MSHTIHHELETSLRKQVEHSANLLTQVQNVHSLSFSMTRDSKFAWEIVGFHVVIVAFFKYNNTDEAM